MIDLMLMTFTTSLSTGTGSWSGTESSLTKSSRLPKGCSCSSNTSFWGVTSVRNFSQTCKLVRYCNRVGVGDPFWISQALQWCQVLWYHSTDSIFLELHCSRSSVSAAAWQQTWGWWDRIGGWWTRTGASSRIILPPGSLGRTIGTVTVRGTSHVEILGDLVQAVMPSLMILQLHALDWWCTYPRACCELVANTTKAGAFSRAILSLVTKAGAFSRAILSPGSLSLVLWPLGILSGCILLDLSSTLLRQGIFIFRQRLEPHPGLSCLWWQGLEPPPGLSCHQVSSFKCSFCGKDIAILYWFTVIVPALVSQALTSFTILSLWLELVGVVSWMTITNQLSLTTVAFSLLQSS